MNTLERILHLVPDAQLIITGNDYQKIKWLDKRPKPTLEEIEAVVEVVEAPKDWVKLSYKLSNSQLFMKAYFMSKDNVAVAQSFNMVNQVVLITHLEESLYYFANDLLSDLSANVTAEELTEVKEILTECGFDNTALGV